MERQKRKNRTLFFAKSALFLFCFLLIVSADAKPFVLKSVDGSWLPMIAQSWTTNNGGVLVKIADGINPNDLRKEMMLKMPDLTIEISGKELIFPATTPDSLFEALKNIDLDVSYSAVKRQAAASNPDIFLKKSADSATSKDEYTEALVEKVVFDEKNEKVILTVRIQQRAKTGMFPKLNGIYRIEHAYTMKNDIVDPTDVKNMAFLPLITLKKGSKIAFIPEKLDSRILTIGPDFKIK